MKRWLSITMRQWIAGGLMTLLGLGVLSGCQPTYLTKENAEQAYSNMLPPVKVDEQCPPTAPLSPMMKAPPNVLQPERPPQYMNLQGAIALALENGKVSGGGAYAPGAGGVADDTLTRFTNAGSLNAQTDHIRVLALNPAIASANMEASLARFDAVWVTGGNVTGTDSLPGVFNPGSLGQIAGTTAQFDSSIVKAFANGGVADVTFLTQYRNYSASGLLGSGAGFSGILNPQYTPRVSLGYEQPLWRDAGVEINELLGRLTSPTGNAFNSTSSAANGFNRQQGALSALAGNGIEGTLISRLRFDQSRAEFERNVHILVLNAEIAYWNLYNKYGQLYSFEDNLRILQKVYQESYHQWTLGKLDPYKYHQIRGQFEEFRGERYRAMQEVLDAERNLRRIIGIPLEDGTRIIPTTAPTLAELRPNWESSLQDALNLRPELVIARDNLKYHQYLLQIQKNNLKPDLRAFAKAEPLGEGSSLIGDGGSFTDAAGTPHSVNAFRSLAGGHLMDYQIGAFMNVPLGFRFEYAAIRSARLQLAQSYYLLRDAEESATSYLHKQYQEVLEHYARIGAARAERLAYLDSLKNLDQQVKVGKITYATDSLQYLVVQRSYANALVKEYAEIAEYNNVLVRLEWAKGTLLKYNNIQISEGALPQAAQVRAVEYEKERTHSIDLRQRPDALTTPGRMCVGKDCDAHVPDALPPISTMSASSTAQSEEDKQAEKRLVEKAAPTPTPEKQIEAKPASLPKLLPDAAPLPAPRVEGPSRPLSLLPAPAPVPVVAAPKQASATGVINLDESLTPAFRPSVEKSADATTPAPLPLPPEFNRNPALTQPMEFLTPLPPRP